MDPYEIVDKILERYIHIIDRNLIGVYLHGSLAMGGYNPSISDIDILVVVRDPLDHKTKRELIEAIMHLEKSPQKGMEMSLILEKNARNFIHPTPFELHYSVMHKERYLKDENYICGGYTDRDLAAHLTIIKHRGVCLYGKEIHEVFGEVPREDYIDAIIYDIEDAPVDILENPIYITLNLCRVLYYLNEGAICSKIEGGKWGMTSLPERYQNLVKDAVHYYINHEEVSNEFNYEKNLLVEYAQYMLKEVFEKGMSTHERDKRPKFSLDMSLQDFEKHYWYKNELAEICRNYQLSASGTKIELEERIKKLLRGDKAKNLRKTISNQRKRQSISEITLETKLIPEGFKFNQQAREFFANYYNKPKFSFKIQTLEKLRMIK